MFANMIMKLGFMTGTSRDRWGLPCWGEFTYQELHTAKLKRTFAFTDKVSALQVLALVASHASAVS